MSDTQTPPAPTPPQRGKGWPTRVLRLGEGLAASTVWLTGAAVALLCSLLLAAWLWSGQAQSLPQALGWAQRWLADDTGHSPLQFSNAQGSLREGGSIGHLRWQQDKLDVQIEDLEVRWPARLLADALIRRRVQIDTLSASSVRVVDERAPSTEPLAPPATLELPWLREVSLPVKLQQLKLEGRTPLALGPVQATYHYGGSAADGQPGHHLDVTRLRWAEGDYTLDAQVQTAAPMAMQVRLDGRIPTRVPVKGGAALDLRAEARVHGTLATRDAALQVQADIRTPAAQTNRPAPYLQANIHLRPWADMPLDSGHLQLQDIDLASLWPGAPVTRLRGAWLADRSDAAWHLRGELTNLRPGPWDRQALPLGKLRADLQMTADQWKLTELHAELANAQLQAHATAQLRPQPQLPWRERLTGWEGELQVQGLHPNALLSTLAVQPMDLSAKVQARGALPPSSGRFEVSAGPQAWHGTSNRALPAPKLQADGGWNNGLLELRQVLLQAMEVEASAQGTLDVAARRFDGTLDARLPGVTAQAKGQWRLTTPQPQAANRPAQTRDQGQLEVELQQASELQRWLRQTLATADRLLPSAKPSSHVPAKWLDLALDAQGSLALDWNTAPGQPTQLAMRHQGTARTSDWNLRTALQAQGQLAWTQRGPDVRMRVSELTLQGTGRDLPYGATLNLQGTPEAHWTNGTLDLQAGRLLIKPDPAPGTPAMSRDPVTLAWDGLRWNEAELTTRGQAQGLALSWLNAWLANPAAPQGPMAAAGLAGELLFQADWDLRLPLHQQAATAHPSQARLSLRRTSGDLALVTGEGQRAERLAAGVSEVAAVVDLTGRTLSTQLRWQSQNAGQIQADARTELAPPTQDASWSWPETAPLQGRVQAALPQVGLWSRLAPPGWRVRGRLQADATLSGTRQQPLWRGTLQADDLALRSLLDGLDFTDGQLLARLDGETVRIDSLRLRGAGGEQGGLLTGSGSATWPLLPAAEGAPPRREPDIELKLQAQQLRLLARADRRLTLSGNVDARLRGQRLDVSGRLRADQALFLLPDESTPTLGDDVVVRGQQRPTTTASGTPVQAHVQLDLSLGDDFQVRGQGVHTWLAGRLQLTSSPSQSAPQLTGQVRTVRGTYRAYGQSLSIEEGVVRFNGAYDNPTLDILALRPHPTQKVGVQISGTARSPRVRLYADPELPDSEKLAWLVLGRPATGAGAEAAVLQQAALALLSGQGRTGDGSLTRALGLDELSFQGEGTNPDGTTTAAALTLGKRISNQLYLSYSRSVVGVMGTVAVLYDVSRYVTLRAQAGDDNAIDLIFTRRFD